MDDPSDRRSGRELEIIAAVASRLNATANLDAALQQLLEGVSRYLGLETGWIWLLDEEDEFYLAAARNLPPGFENNPRWVEGDCYCQKRFGSGQLSEAENVDVLTCSRLAGLEGGSGGLEYHASVPIVADDTRLGVINLASAKGEEPTPEELELLGTVTDMLAVAVERTRLYERSRRLGALEERHRVARDLHDTLAQKLVAVTMQLETADIRLEQADDSADGAISTALEEALELSRAALEDTRRCVENLRARPLDGRPLPEAIAGLVEQLDETNGVSVTFEQPQQTGPLPGRIAHGLYRAAEEALRNAVAHAGATQLFVTLERDRREVRLAVTDDGQGFDPDDVDADRFGLVGIGERIRRLGGKLTIDTAPGAGTTIRARVPLEAG